MFLYKNLCRKIYKGRYYLFNMVKKNKLDNETRSAIAFVKKWLSCEKYAKMSIQTPEGKLTAQVMSDIDSGLIVIEIRQDNNLKAVIEYNHSLNSWRRLE
jgi:hypothetical protein